MASSGEGDVNVEIELKKAYECLVRKRYPASASDPS